MDVLPTIREGIGSGKTCNVLDAENICLSHASEWLSMFVEE